MKKIDFIMAGIVSAMWAIITCIYCGWGNTINLNNHVEIGGGWYIPLPSRYWDWLFIGLYYITTAWCLRGHWLPNRKQAMSDKEDGQDATLFFLSFLVTCVVAIGVITITQRDAVSKIHISLLVTFACIGARRGVSQHRLMGAICLASGINLSFFGWSFALLSLLTILIAKVLIWLAVNTVRSGFSTAWRQLWRSLVFGQKLVGETGQPPNSAKTDPTPTTLSIISAAPSQKRTGTGDATMHFGREESGPQ